ncbi:MAG TPA: shikimate kinase [Chthonomonadaceae bacterium]|nr:shikimate kinase [Chthonomonadaceae bacterium]
MASNLVLIGFMGTGKTTVGRLCAARLGYRFCDSDAVIEARTGGSIARFFEQHGEAAFRQMEREVIRELAATPGLVIATGGGAALNPENVADLRAGGRVVLLTASPEVLLKRVGDARSRPLLADAADPRARIATLLADRLPHYERAAHHRVNTTDRRPQEIAAEIVAWYRAQESDT